MANNIEKGEKATSERLFTQAELSKLINKRLSRERRNNASLSKVYKLLKELAEKKIINASSYAEAAQELQNKLMLLCNDENMKIDDGTVGKQGGESKEIEWVPEQESANAFEETENTAVNLSESFADELYSDDCEICENESSGQGTENYSCEKEDKEVYALSEISEFLEHFPDSRALKIIVSREFLDFCRGRQEGLCELYDSFCKHFGKLSSLFDGEEKTESEHLTEGAYNNINPRRVISEYSSTGFSGRSASPSSDDGANLSPLQRKIAKSAGISYREYASILRDIPQYSKSDKRTLTKIRI